MPEAIRGTNPGHEKSPLPGKVPPFHLLKRWNSLSTPRSGRGTRLQSGGVVSRRVAKTVTDRLPSPGYNSA